MSLHDLTTVGLQIILPLDLLAWFALAPENSLVGYGVQVIAIGRPSAML